MEVPGVIPSKVCKKEFNNPKYFQANQTGAWIVLEDKAF
jgi:hypothetical protein